MIVESDLKQIKAIEEEGLGSTSHRLSDSRNEWQGQFRWDMLVDQTNRKLFGNELFREN